MSVLSLTVSAIMTKDPVSVAPGDSLAQVRRDMLETGGHHVPVVDAGRFVGLLSPADLLQATDADAFAKNPEDFDAELAAVTAQHAMAEDVLTIAPDATVRKACELLTTGSFHCLPVVDAHGMLRGLLTTTDILTTLLHVDPG